jgi:fido (protein-threonine AMPylation protein)
MEDSESLETFELPDELLPLLTMGAIEDMLLCRNNFISDEDTSGYNIGNGTGTGTGTKAHYTVCTYPDTIPIPEDNDIRLNGVFISDSNYIYIHDGMSSVRAIILDQHLYDLIEFAEDKMSLKDILKTNLVIIHIYSYITSYGNINQDEPILCITEMDWSIPCELPFVLVRPEPVDRSNNRNTITGVLIQEFEPLIYLCHLLDDGYVVGGKINNFLTNIAPRLTYEAISGCYSYEQSKAYIPTTMHNKALRDLDDVRCISSRISNTSTTNEIWKDMIDKLRVISDFMLKHEAIDKLRETTIDTGITATKNLPSSIALYISALESFRTTQLERMEVSRHCKSNDEGQVIPTPLMQRHQEVLKTILETKYPWIDSFRNDDDHNNDDINEIDVNMLHWLHSLLCHDLIPDAGQFRTTSKRVGKTCFFYTGPMDTIMVQFLSSIQHLRTRLLSEYDNCNRMTNNNNQKQSMLHPNKSPTLSNKTAKAAATTTTTTATTPSTSQQTLPNQDDEKYNMKNTDLPFDQRRLLAYITYGAAVYMGILDIHPYSDANGRLARIVLNWILYHQLKVPYTISFVETMDERILYFMANSETRRNIALTTVGNVPEDILLSTYIQCGAFRPTVELIVNRLYKSVTEFNQLVQQKEKAHCEELETITLRRFREQTTSDGLCQICLDGQPNMSLLCCGTAYHMNCAARWLKSNSSCPQCRSEIPCLESTTAPDNEATSNLRDNISDLLAHRFSELFLSSTTNEATRRTGSTTTRNRNGPPECEFCNVRRAAWRCTNNRCLQCCRLSGDSYCPRHEEI